MMHGGSLLIFGASGPTGCWLVRHARARGYRVSAMLRAGRDAEELQNLGVSVLRGDALNEQDCRTAIETARPQAVVSLLGGRNAQGQRVDAAGNIHVIEALLGWKQCRRLLLVTSYGCGDQFAALGSTAQRVLGEALRAKSLAEECLIQSDLDWTIVRPGGLSNEPACDRYCLNPEPEDEVIMYLPRSDAALAICDLLPNAATIARIITVLGVPIQTATYESAHHCLWCESAQ